MRPDLLLSLKAGAAALVLGLVLGGWGAHEFYAPRLELAERKVKDLGEKLDEQNQAVERLEQEGKDLAARVKRAQAEAARLRAEQDKGAIEILTLPLPPGVDQCVAASDLIRRELAK